VYLAADGGHELAGVGLAEGVEGVALVHGEEGEPLLQHVVQVAAHVLLRLRQLVAEGKSCTRSKKLDNYFI
jgi:hypothetical protein